MLSERVQEGQGVPSGDKDQVRDYLRELDPCKSMGKNRLHPRLLRELVRVHTRLLSSLNGCGDWGRAPMAGEMQTMYQSSEKVKVQYRELQAH